MGSMEAALFEAPAPGGGAPHLPPGREPELRRAPEPMFNAPWTVLALTAVIVGGYAIQSRFPLEAVALSYAFAPSMLQEGEWPRLITSLFLHGSWAHALMNAAFGLAFGTPVARYFGERLGGAALFFLFFLTCGVLSSLGFAALHLGEQSALVGASGAVSGLMGGAARLIAGRGQVGPILSRPVLGMGLAWLLVNLLVALIGSGMIPGAGGVAIAWEAHVAGFVAGVLVFDPFAWLARRA